MLTLRDHRAGWRNVKHASQWTNTLTTYVSPVFGKVPVAAIDTGLVTKVLRPLWATKPETAGRVRGRVEAILDWAAAQGYRQGDNPARWRGHLDKLLPARSKVRAIVHHAALPYDEMPTFMADAAGARGHRGAGAGVHDPDGRANRRGYRRDVGRDEPQSPKSGRCPPRRMKGGREHRVPLDRRRGGGARSRCAQLRQNEFVFPGGTAGHDEQHGDGDAPATNGPRRYCAWVSIDLPRLGGRADELSERGSRGGARACCRGQGRGRLSARRSI